MDAHESVPQPAAPSADSAAPPESTLTDREFLALIDGFFAALRVGGIFDDLDVEQAGRYEAGMRAIASEHPVSRRIGYRLLMEAALCEPRRVAGAMERLWARLEVLRTPPPAAARPPTRAADPLETVLVSREVAFRAEQLLVSPVTRWIDGALYVGASLDVLHRVVSRRQERVQPWVWLLTAEHELWLLSPEELAQGHAA